MVVIVILVFSFSSYKAWLNFSFFVGDDLVLNLEPKDRSFSIHYGDTQDVSISAEVENSLFCNAFCTYEFKDLSVGETLDEGTFTSNLEENKFEKTFSLEADRVGAGQKLYSFKIKCNNMREFFCPSNEDIRERSSFITLNYDISESEKLLKETLRKNITNLIKELEILDVDVQKLNSRFFKLSFDINLKDFVVRKENINQDYNNIIIELEGLERVWSEENYFLLEELFNKSYDKRISELKEDILAFEIDGGIILDKHNSIIEDVNGLRLDNSTSSLLENSYLYENYNYLLEDLKNLSETITKNSFDNYSILTSDAEILKIKFEELKLESKKLIKKLYLEGTYYNVLERDKLCMLGMCLDRANFAETILRSVNAESQDVKDACSSLNNLLANYENITRINETKVDLIKDNILDEISNLQSANEINQSLEILFNLSEEHTVSGVIDNKTLEFNQTYCGFYSNLTPEDIDKIKDVEGKNFTSMIDIELSENFPVCCVFGDCNKCCSEESCDDESLYPVLFLHGHSFNSDNSPDYSLDAFNKIQTRLQEDGYVSAGTITPKSEYSEIEKGNWGLSSKPVSVKGSYYLISFYDIESYSLATQKSENIETYAIRLKELVDLLKFRTGKDKINVIAHSMGGLVVRSYMQIFGDGDINKLIMIATPNKGISGQINNYCPILGEKKECNDMSSNSIFVKKINDPNKIPKNARIFNIIGEGCDGGDGIVNKENGVLDYTENFFVNGSCEGFSDLLHTQVLDIDRYPKVYDLIKDVLKN